ncbi:MAG TPA: acyltransferase domain-containing protein, partial [Jatrophihabitans sp.]|nr:acyltransferase domain-containing protein [Jatrophihabitans sp.]
FANSPFYVNGELSPWPARGGRPKIAGINSLGMGGTNVHVVVEQAPSRVINEPTADSARRYQVLPVSARNPVAADQACARLADHLAATPESRLLDVAYTLQVGRKDFEHRRVLVAGGRDEAIAGLAGKGLLSRVETARGRQTAFLFTGVGEQYPGMVAELYRREPVFRAELDDCLRVLTDQVPDTELLDLLTGERSAGAGLATLLGRADASTDPRAALLEQTETAQPLLFAVEYALARTLIGWGVQPRVMFGYSLGEYVAACLAGVFTLPDALQIVVERARLIAEAPAGGMVSVAADEQTVLAQLAGIDTEVGIAALNGPAMTVLSGPAAEVELVTERMLAAGLACRPLRTEHAFHSALLEPARDKLAALIESLPRQVPTIPIVSNRDGAELSPEQAMSGEYWADHLVQPVRFAQSVGHCADRGIDVYLELGAGQTLGGLVRQNLTGGGALVLGTLPARWSAGERPDETAELLACYGQLWQAGFPVRLPSPSGRIVELPHYAFQRSRFWPDGGTPVAKRSASTEAKPSCYTPTWRLDVAAPAPVAPAEGLVILGGGAVGAALADQAKQAGIVVQVMDPEHPEEFKQLLAGLPGDSPVRLAYLGGLPGQSVFPSDAELKAALRQSFDTLLLGLQAAGELARNRGLQLVTVSHGALEVLGGDALAPVQSVAHGLGRTARHEYPGLTWQGVDLDPELTDPIELAQQLQAE